MSISTLVTILAAGSLLADSTPVWDDLKTTWGPTILNAFNPQPRTVQDAEKGGFKLVGSAECGGTGAYHGIAYVKDEDYSLTLLYDKNGFIAGIQNGITKEIAQQIGYPHKLLQPPYVFFDGRYVISAYFTDPSKICTVGRTQEEFEVEGTGTDLWLQTGTTPSEVTLIPKEQKNLNGTKWVENKCVYSMGTHYWYDVKDDMDCAAFYPVFLLYNDGKLNAFGWHMLADLSSPNYEHFLVSIIAGFLGDVPQCAYTVTPTVSSIHVYLTAKPLLNFC